MLEAVRNSVSFIQADSLHLIGNLQREARLFVNSDVVVFDFGAYSAHQVALELHRLMFNGREALIIV